MADNDTNVFQNSEISWPRSLRFWVLLIFDIPSIICSFFVLYYLIFDRTLRHALHNHTIVVLLILALIFQLTDIPWYLDFIRRSIVWPQTPARCLIWWLVDLGFYNTAAIILAWASVERHILIFHGHWISTQKKRLLLHYLPLAILLLYSTIYYTVLIFFPPCQHTYDYTLPVCSATPCHLLDPILGIWEMGIHGCLCTMIIACFSIALLIRVIVHKRRGRRMFQWKKYRKMISQLLLISSLYLIINLPGAIMWVGRFCGLVPTAAYVEAQLVGFFITYWAILLLPVVSLVSLPDLKKKVFQLVYWRGRYPATVAPMTRCPTTVPGIRQ
ncbi:unnamed protein product [Rotaria sp. Silwood2]|nr:unnamed protein product [Rotaria sp. Silwood2]CAF2738262.1 unnamed protein product [Rotaria sp. Silwood2]CAF2830218.1 unnamed protein product [Rotaria sp. Silwood2]CAF2906084.1 unnamed protein product [Rotaria sp. Silwood2]CAF3958143.1 unnamed protein product [Rotaria sp. Silwood2]